MPAQPDLEQSGEAYAQVRTADGPGWAALAGIAADLHVAPGGGAFDYELRWMAPPGHALVTIYGVTTADAHGYPALLSRAVLPGPPVDGSFDPGFLDPPVVESWASMHDPVSWQPVAAAATDQIRLQLFVGLDEVGTYLLAPDETEATLPRMPTQAPLPTWWPDGPKRLTVGACATPVFGRCTRYAAWWVLLE